MKLTLSEVRVVVERRYTLDEPVVVDTRGASYRATEFVTITRAYEYGEIEREHLIRAQVLKQDGTPNMREQVRDIAIYAPTGEFAELTPNPLADFIKALNDAADS